MRGGRVSRPTCRLSTGDGGVRGGGGERGRG